ncbi:MAG: FAD:protein FMN transferase [Caldisericia bacterium]|nr:FAD:protein FMN transferase [Caldisericia bacterium]
MGTFLIITIDNNHKNIISKINEKVIEIEDKFSRFKESSYTSKINKNKGEWVEVDEEFIYVLEKAIYFNKISNNAFNPLVGDIVNEWGFYDGNYKIPDESIINKLIKEVDIENILIDKEKKMVKIISGSLDFGGIVKGYTLDKIKEILEKNNVQEAIVNFGGNILVLGNRTFNIGVKNPRGNGVIYTFEVKNGATVSTSGDYENYFIKDNKRYHHIINPETGNPSQNGIIEVSVVSEKGIDGDALSTTLFVLGKEKGKEFIKNYFKNIKVLFVDENLNKEIIDEKD